MLSEEGFKVTDTQTGEEPDLEEIALNEDWAKELIYCDMEGFALQDDGTLILCDETGRFVYCPEGRFKIELALVARTRREVLDGLDKDGLLVHDYASCPERYHSTCRACKLLREARKEG